MSERDAPSGPASSGAPPASDPSPDSPSPIVPSAPVWATVRLADPPDAPPADLVAFMSRRGDDWLLTDDAIAFGRHDVIQRFSRWRSGWERTWVLDPLTNVLWLVDLADQQGLEFGRLWRCHRTASGDVLIPPEFLDAFRRAMGELATHVRERHRLGIGLVDTSPGSVRTGLARGWPDSGRAEVVAEVVAEADGTAVVHRPGSGLHLESALTSRHRADLGQIEWTRSDEHGWTVATIDDGRRLRFELDPVRARPIAWLVPAATAWTVRRVPEAAVLASTLVRLPAALDVAESIGRGVTLTARRPIASGPCEPIVPHPLVDP